MLSRIARYLSTRSKVFLIVLNALMVLVLGFIDCLAGYELALSILYLFPVAITAWFVSRNAAFAISLFGALVWYAADILAGHVYSHVFIGYWNTVVRLGFFLINSYLVFKIRETHEYERQLSREDALTGVANVRSFYEYMEQEINRFQRFARPFTLVLIDLDNFKSVNDQQGHDVGDQLLRRIAQTMKNNVRSVDVVARLGGDEFALLFPECDLEQAKQTMGRLYECLNAIAHDFDPVVTFSAGVVTVLTELPTIKETIRIVDNLMYEAKRTGKNKIKFKLWSKPSALDNNTNC